MRVCLDTNVLVSAFVGRGLCADVLRVVLARYHLVLGATVLGELDRVLRAKMGVPEAVVADALDLLRAEAAEVVAEALEPVAGLDIEDGRVVAEAVAGRADMLITGDQALLRADAMPVIVLSPRGFWERSRTEGGVG
ncbi:MAG: putative toxin-antitoxin system toxin component, PIN family [Longimicrobiales bacterium]